MARSRALPHTSSPRRLRLNGPCIARPGPPGGIFTRFVHHDPRWKNQRRACPRRPGSYCLREHPSDRTPGLDLEEGTSLRTARLCSDEPPSNRTSVSPRIRLYGTTPPRLVRPRPSAAGEATFPGGVARHDGVSTALACLTAAAFPPLRRRSLPYRRRGPKPRFRRAISVGDVRLLRSPETA